MSAICSFQQVGQAILPYLYDFCLPSHFFVSWCWIQTCAPKGKLAISWACAFLFAVFCACVLLLGRLSILIGVGLSCIGSFWGGSLLKNSWPGLIPSAVAMFLHAAIASSRFAFSAWVRVLIAFKFLTAASARPLDSGLCAEASSCSMELDLQKLANSCLNWGTDHDLFVNKQMEVTAAYSEAEKIHRSIITVTGMG